MGSCSEQLPIHWKLSRVELKGSTGASLNLSAIADSTQKTQRACLREQKLVSPLDATSFMSFADAARTPVPREFLVIVLAGFGNEFSCRFF